MNLDHALETLPPEIDRRLDELLAGWSQARQLDSAQAAAIQQKILIRVEELSPGWWPSYLQQLNATLDKVNRVQKTIATGIQRQQLSHLAAQIGWTPQNADQWQPYIKVA